ADGAADNWTFLESLSPETEVIDFWHACEHLRVASDHAVAPHWFEKHRKSLRHDPRGVAKVIRALCYLRDSAKGARAQIERELAYFRKHRHRMRYHALKEEGIAIRSGVLEATCKTLVVQRLKRPGMSPATVRRAPAARRKIEGCQRESIIAVPCGRSVHGCRN
ncbi:MAG: hypothetical protein OXF79_24645, partial [Chloroflexi bacterium]|nr:hypothetical protein [Chloroflexota bacterium]